MEKDQCPCVSGRCHLSCWDGSPLRDRKAGAISLGDQRRVDQTNSFLQQLRGPRDPRTLRHVHPWEHWLPLPCLLPAPPLAPVLSSWSPRTSAAHSVFNQLSNAPSSSAIPVPGRGSLVHPSLVREAAEHPGEPASQRTQSDDHPAAGLPWGRPSCPGSDGKQGNAVPASRPSRNSLGCHPEPGWPSLTFSALPAVPPAPVRSAGRFPSLSDTGARQASGRPWWAHHLACLRDKAGQIFVQRKSRGLRRQRFSANHCRKADAFIICFYWPKN